MADIVISVVARIAEYLVKPVVREGKNFLCINEVIKELEKEKNDLKFEKDKLLIPVNQAKERSEIIEEPVNQWLSEVVRCLKEVEEALEKGTNTSCFQGKFPTWGRYLLCKKMREKADEMRKLKTKANFPLVSRPARIPKKFANFKSTKEAYQQLWTLLQDDRTNMIGVYGMSGCGKTILVTEVGTKAKEEKMFDKVISITVSQTLNIRAMQGKIADMIGLKLEEESDQGRAPMLLGKMKSYKRILFIIDDLWKRFDLKDIGIDINNVNKGAWKILVTTRDLQVCRDMNCQEKINLRLLSEDESWTLFKKYADIKEEDSKSWDGVPRKLCDECNGLPLTIVSIASSLKGKHRCNWEVALHNLSNPTAFEDHDEGVRNALSILELSYKSLQNKEAELLFLMCSMFPEDYEILIEDLVQYAVGLGVGRRSSLEMSRHLVQVGIDKLLDSCLLIPAKDVDYVKMHDLAREVAISISKRSENRKILVNVDKPLNTLAGDDTIHDYFAESSGDDTIPNYFAVSSWWHNEYPIIDQLQVKNLKMLLLNIDTYMSKDSLSHLTFEEIKGLKVFSLIDTSYGVQLLFQLSSSIQLLKNVRTLRLNRLILGDISSITKLTMLKILDLQDCDFNELPYEIGNLRRLQLLDLSRCPLFQKPYNGAIGTCSQLEELYISPCYARKAVPETVSKTVVDIGTLSKLQYFSIHDGFPSLRLQKRTRLVVLKDFDISKLRASKKNILQRAENIDFTMLHGGCKNIIPDMAGVVGGMNGLTSLKLKLCKEIECIFDMISNVKIDDLIPKLVELNLSMMDNLTELYHGPPQHMIRFFDKLQKLVIRYCSNLRITFPSECNLQNLKILTLVGCKSEEVLFPTSVAKSLQQLECLEIYGLCELKLIIAASAAWEKMHDDCNTNEEISLMSSLKEINIFNCPMLICIFGECDNEHYSSQNHNIFPQLEILRLTNLDNFIGMYPENIHAKWPPSQSLKEVYVVGCDKFTVMIHSNNRLNQNILPLINSTISWMDPTTSRQIWSHDCLQILKVKECRNLKSLFSMEESKCLPELKSLVIYSCIELEEIVSGNAEMSFPKLKDITVEGCPKLKSLFPVAMVKMLPQLSDLYIADCNQFEECFRRGVGGGSGDGTINEIQEEIVLPSLAEIALIHLPNFVDICRGCKLPAIKLDIFDCPKISSSLKEIQEKILKDYTLNSRLDLYTTSFENSSGSAGTTPEQI